MKHNRLQLPGLRISLSLLLAFLSTLAFLTPTKIPGWEETVKMAEGSTNRVLTTIAKFRILLEDRGMLGLFVLAALFFLFRWFFQKRMANEYSFRPSAAVLALIFAILMPVGASIQQFNGLDFILENRFQMMYSVLLAAGWWALFYVAIRVLFAYLDSWLAQTPKNQLVPSKFRRVQELLLDKHPILIPMLVMLLCWLPYWIAYFPGSVSHDPLYQLDQFFGVHGWDNHHPIFSTIVQGCIFACGRFLGGDNIGVAFCVGFQLLSASFSFALALHLVKKWNVSLFVRWSVLLFFALFPAIPLNLSAVVKDNLSTVLLFLFGITYLFLIQTLRQGKPCRKMFSIVVILGIFCGLFRHNNLYICVLAILLLLFLKADRNIRIPLLPLLLSAFVIYAGVSLISDGLVETLDAKETNIREALSIPFQQTARYVKEHGDEVTAEERAAIDAVLDYSKLAENYTPEISDNVKHTFRNNKDVLPQYLVTWFKMFWKHPLTYLEATLANTHAYYCPNAWCTRQEHFQHYMKADGWVYTGFFDYDYVFGSGVRNSASGVFFLTQEIPGIGLLCHWGTYTWVLLLACTYTIYRKRYYMILGTAPAMITFLTCIASPVNGHIRYFLPTLLLTPVVVCWMLSELKTDDPAETQQIKGDVQ